jgi:biotin carboxylase
MKKPALLILGVSEEMIPLIRLAQDAGCLVVGTDRNPDSSGLHAVDRACVVDTSDRDALQRLLLKERPDAMLTRVEALLPLVAEMCVQHRMPGPSLEVAALSVDKYLFRERMAAAGLRTPRYGVATHADEMPSLLSQTGLPVVVKPVDHSGSTGVARASTVEEAQKAFSHAYRLSPSGRVIVEELLHGREFSVETWTDEETTHIAAITEKRVSGNGHFVELRHTIPANITAAEAEAIEAEVQQMALVMKPRWCLTHTEVMLTERGTVLIETGARPGGDMIGLRLVEMATGINMNRVWLSLAFGERPPVMKRTNRASLIQYVTSENKPKADQLHAALLKDPNFAGYHQLREDNPGRLHASTDRIACYLFTANSPELMSNTIKLIDEL